MRGVKDVKMCLSDFRAGAGGAAEHLLKQNTAVDLSHKHKVANGVDINTSRQQINRYRDIGIPIVFELLDDL